jgi:hypothetical protein
VNARKNDSEATVIMIKMIHTVFLVIFIMSSAEMAVAQPVGDKNQLVPTVKVDVFSFYTTRQMRVLAQSYLAVSERGDKASANDRVKGAEFRGYLFGKAEGFHPAGETNAMPTSRNSLTDMYCSIDKKSSYLTKSRSKRKGASR